ncbi:MAG: dockerin type I repeat-containing protein [Clostridia bacterium]|nr:dockerin type I repeat-containing protein [Clostridia bacterium]
MMKNTTSATMSGWARGYAVTKGKRRMKRSLLILLVAVLLFSVCGLPATAAKTRKAGDVDGDGSISSADARLALRRSVGLETYKNNSPEFTACDVDFDGDVTAADARLILRGSVGLEDPATWKKPAVAVPKKLVAKDTVAFTMQIPEGWELRFGWDGEKMLLIRVYDPKQPVNQIFYATDMVPFMKSEAAAQWYARTDTKLFSEAPVLDPPTNETLFKQIPKLRSYHKDTLKSEATVALLPEIYDFKLIQTLPNKSASKEYAGLDESILYGSFQNAAGSAKGEGLGYASILDHFGDKTDWTTGVDPTYYFVYNLTALTSAKGTFADYEEILCRSFSTLKLKDDFVKKMLKNSDAFFKQGKEVNASINAVYEKINAAWDARMKGDDLN